MFPLQVVCLLFSLKLRYPKRVCLVRGNHEDRYYNDASFGVECEERC